MADATVTTTHDIPGPVRSRLSALRRRIALWFLVDGASRVLLLLVVLAAFDLLVDWLFRMDLAQRWVMLVLIVGGLCAMAYWRLIRPFLSRPDDDALCLEVEEHHKQQLGESLISSVQFSRMGNNVPDGVSRDLVHATIDDGVRRAEQVNFADSLNAQRFYVNLALLLVSIAAIGAGVVAVQNTAWGKTWFDRNVVMRDDVFWPQDTYLILEGQDLKGDIVVITEEISIPRGDDWKLTVKVRPDSKEVPETVYIDRRFGSSRSTIKMDKVEPAEESDEGPDEELIVPVPEDETDAVPPVDTEPASDVETASPAGEPETTPPADSESENNDADPADQCDEEAVEDVKESAEATDEPSGGSPIVADEPADPADEPADAPDEPATEKPDAATAPPTPDVAPATDEPAETTGPEHLGEFEFVFHNVTEELEFRVRGGDETTKWIKVRLVERPAVSNLMVEVTPPQYTKQPMAPLPSGSGPHYVLPGSGLRIVGESNKRLTQGVLRIAGVVHDLQLTGEQSFEVVVPPEEIVPASRAAAKSAKYEIELTDDLGLTSNRSASFELRIRPDRSPRVRAKLSGVTGMVVPKAKIPFWTRITDDYAIKDAYLDYQWDSESGEDSGGSDVRFSDEDVASQFGKPEIEFNEVWDLRPLNLATGIALRFRLKASDNDDITPEKEAGASPEFLLRVVTEEELRSDMLRREKEVREELQRLKKNQEDLLIDCRALTADVGGQPDFDAAQRQELIKVQRRQKLVGTNTANIALRLEEIVKEVKNNRLEEEDESAAVTADPDNDNAADEHEGPLQKRLNESIIGPLNLIAETEVVLAVRFLDGARIKAGLIDERDELLVKAADQQERIIEAMDRILTHMVKVEDYQEAVNLLYEIEKEEKKVLDLTEKANAEEIKRIFEQDGGDAPEDKNPEDKKSGDPESPE